MHEASESWLYCPLIGTKAHSIPEEVSVVGYCER